MSSRPGEQSAESLAHRAFYLMILGAKLAGADELQITLDESARVAHVKDNGVLKFSSRGLSMLHERIGQGLRSIERWSPSLFRLAGALQCSDELKVIAENCSIQMKTQLFLKRGVKTVIEDRHSSGGTSLSFSLSDTTQWNLPLLKRALAPLVQGCSLRVWLNGEQLEAPFAQSAKFKSFQYGHYDLCYSPRSQAKTALIYHNGLPVRLSSKLGRLPGALTVHLDPSAVSSEYDEANWTVTISDTDAAFIHAELMQVWQRFLEYQKQLLKPSEFTRRFAQACYNHGMRGLLDDVPLHPSMWGVYTRLPAPGQPGVPGQFLHGDRLLKPSDEVVLDLEWIEGWSGSLAATFVYGLGWPVITAEVSEGHWALKSALNPSSLRLKVTPYGVAGKQTFQTGLLTGIQVVFCSGYEITCLNHPAKVYIEEVPTFCADTATLFVTQHSHRDLQVLIWQIGAYLQPAGKNTLRDTVGDAKNLLRLMGGIFGYTQKVKRAPALTSARIH